MKRLIFLLLFIPVLLSGQNVLTDGTKVLTDGTNVLTTVISAFSDEYQAVYDAFTTKPSDAIAAEQNTMVAGLVADGVWIKLDLFYVFAQTVNTAGEALINWFNPGTFDATNVHATAFTALEGFTGDGANDYIDCNWAPAGDGINYVQDDASVGVYARNNVNEGKVIFACAPVSNFDVTLQLRSSNFAGIRLNSTTSSSVANTDSRGMFISNRVLSTHQDLYRNKTRIVNGAVASNGVSAINFFVMAYNPGSPSLHTTIQASLFFAGGGFTQTDVDNITDRFEIYMDSNGKGVIP